MRENIQLTENNTYFKRSSCQQYYLVDSIIVLFSFFMLCGYGFEANIASTICALVILEVACLSKFVLYKSSYLTMAVISFLLFFIYYFITSLFNINSLYYWLGSIISIDGVVRFLPLIIFAYISNRWTYRRILNLYGWLSVVWFSLVFISIAYYIYNPGLARNVIVYQDEYKKLLIGNGYPLAYGSAVLAVFVSGLMSSNSFTQKRERRLAVITIVVSVFHVYLTQSTLTLMYMLLGILLTISLKTYNNQLFKKRKLNISGIVIAILAIVIIFHKFIGSFLLQFGDYSSNNVYKRRLYEIAAFLSTNYSTRHFAERVSRLTLSLNLIKEHPLFGIGHKFGYVFSLMKQNGLGTHSEILDSIAKYGVVGAAPLFATYIFFVKFIQESLGEHKFITWWLVIILLAFTNPYISSQTNFILFLYIPIMQKLTFREELN